MKIIDANQCVPILFVANSNWYEIVWEMVLKVYGRE